MARTPSTMLEIGTELPDYSLTNGLTKEAHTLKSLHQSNGLLVAFICNHCPFVIHVKEEIKRLASFLAEHRIGMVAINSNDVANYPDDSPEKMKAQGYTFPYLYDETQDVAKAFKAACTPDFYLFDGNKRLYYRGQLDNARPANEEPLDGHSIRNAVEAMLFSKNPDSVEQKPSLGCNIKWKAGNEPNYYGS